MSSSYGHHAAGGPPPGGQASFHSGAYSNISSLSSLKSPTQVPSQHMGSSHSKGNTPPVPSSSSFKGLSAAVTGGIGFKRVFASRRKKSQDLIAKSAEHDLSPPLSTSEILNISGKNSFVQQPSSPTPPNYDNRPPSQLLVGKKSPNRGSILPITPGISPAVNYMLRQEQPPSPGVAKPPRSQPQPQPQTPPTEKVKLPSSPDNVEMKESWRKSDSTNSHTTVRPGGNGGSTRTSRPVSLAESFQSTYTVVQVSNKRLSALITDGMPEEGDESFVSCDDNSGSHPLGSTPSSSLKLKHRSSMSLNLALNKKIIPPPASASMAELKHSFSPVVSPSTILDTFPPSPIQKRTLPSTNSPMSFNGRQSQTSTANNFRGKFAAWANLSSDNLSRQDCTLPAIPPEQRRPSLPHYAAGVVTSPTSPRQTTISMTAGGLAAGLAKRAVEKMSRRWGIGLSPSTSGSGSGYSSSSSSTNAPSSFSSVSHPDYGLVRTNSNRSTPSVHSHIAKSSHSHGSAVGGSGRKRTDAPSGAYSVHPDADNPFTSSGPVLGTMLRGRLDKNGLVFGRDLKIVTKETGVNGGNGMRSVGLDAERMKEGLVFELEGRLLPAIVVRCAQHLLIWGVQEEGLFRVSGRPSHVSKLRSEFDSGVDYDMTECSPGDLDPHAVASVFKAYLRELPESILTQALSPLFDAAIKKEAFTNLNALELNRLSGVGLGNKGNPGLPQGPKNGFSIRKPPSLSTLSMPTFSGIPPPSTLLVSNIKSLISQLPQENYDLLRTVVDLIKATGKESTMTKMPLSNLMLVFCPSLNMAPPLLKVFCEAEDIWAEATDSPLPPSLPSKAGQFAQRKEAADTTDSSEEDNDEDDEVERKSLMSSGRASLDTTNDPSSGYHASAEEEASSFEEGQFKRRRYLPERNTERSEIPTIYLDTMSHCSSSSGSLELSGRHHRYRMDLKDSTDDGSVSPASSLVHLVPPVLSPSTLLRSSVESVSSITSEVSASFSQLPVQDDGGEGRSKMDGVDVEIVDSDPIPLSSAPTPTAKKTSFSHLSPTNDDDATQFPQLPTTPSIRQKRISIPVLSLPNFSPPFLTSSEADRLKDEDSPCPSPTIGPNGVNMLNKRSKRPSLRLLFSKNKKSGSSLNSLGDRSGNGILIISNPIQQHLPRSPAWDSGTSDSSGSTPLSAVTAASALSSLSHLPPVLDTPIDGSPLSLNLGFDGSSPETARGTRDQKLATSPTPTVTFDSTNLVLPQTPSTSQVSIVSEAPPLSPKTPYPSLSVPSENLSSGSPQLSLLDVSEEEDWTRSVLSAADRL